jgi:tRNA G18 (ribose-2'-O)-methylase SpoU
MKVIILENIRSAYNVGAIFRTADASGVDKIYLVGYTPAPTDRFGRMQPEIKKTSLGASEYIEWEQVGSITQVIDRLKETDFQVVAIEINNNSQSLIDFVPQDKVAYILGNEVEGVSDEALSLADQVRHLPMLGKKESLNVSVTAGIVMYHGLYHK